MADLVLPCRVLQISNCGERTPRPFTRPLLIRILESNSQLPGISYGGTGIHRGNHPLQNELFFVYNMLGAATRIP